MRSLFPTSRLLGASLSLILCGVMFLGSGCSLDDLAQQNGDIGQCEAYPSCKEGYKQVDTCGSSQRCEDVTICGQTITCELERSFQCKALPSCKEGYEQVPGCGPSQTCEETTLCGTTITCQQIDQNNQALPPECPRGTVKKDCDLSQSTCQLMEYWGGNFTCEQVAQCDAEPSCEPGWTPYQACPPDTMCKTVTACGKTISCGKSSSCNLDDACPTGSRPLPEGETCTMDRCFQVEVCGRPQLCLRDEEVCDKPPVCPKNTKEVDVCNDRDPCITETSCGKTISCQVSGSDCGAEPVCRPGFSEVPACPRDGRPCERVVECGKVITCAAEKASCQQLEPPTCENGVKACVVCDASQTYYELPDGCGGTYNCPQPRLACNGLPVCKEGWEQVALCDVNRKCEYAYACSSFILCQQK